MLQFYLVGTLTAVFLTVLIAATAILYASVGQGGASGYLAAMALLNVSPEVMRPVALTLNILVASIGAVKYYRAGYFTWAIFWPFALTSIPFAFLGGRLVLPGPLYRIVIGLVLLYAAYRLFRSTLRKSSRDEGMRGFNANPISSSPHPGRPPWLAALALGLGIGLLAGLTGIGGGIFLSPVLLQMKWADLRQAAAASAVFIVVNSSAGLLGQLSTLTALPPAMPWWALAAMVGGLLGAEYGRRHLASGKLQRALAAVLVIAGLRLIFS